MSTGFVTGAGASGAKKRGCKCTRRRPAVARAAAPDAGQENRSNIVELRKVSYAFGSAVVIDGLDLDLVEGEIVCLLGPSGGHCAAISWQITEKCSRTSSAFSPVEYGCLQSSWLTVCSSL